MVRKAEDSVFSQIVPAFGAYPYTSSRLQRVLRALLYLLHGHTLTGDRRDHAGVRTTCHNDVKRLTWYYGRWLTTW
jgi:hypothetical protein